MASSTALPWLWVIEALASFNQVDASVLKELIKKVPEITGDLGKDAGEMVHFRVLDTLAARGVGRNGSVSPAPISDNRFDQLERCEDVVGRILLERTDDAEMFKQQVNNFIAQKRVVLPKYTLQKLKDAIIEGKHPVFASLKARSGLSTSSQSKDRADMNEATIHCDGQTVAEERNLSSLDAGNLNGVSQENGQNRILTPSKRDTHYLESENQALSSHNDSLSLNRGSDTNVPISKKLKGDVSLSGPAVGHECPPAVRDEPSEALVDELNLDIPVVVAKESENYCADMRTSNAAPPNQAHHVACSENNTVCKKSQPTPSNGVPHDKSYSNDFSHEAEHATNSNPGEESSSDSDGYQDERVQIAARKCSFLSSQSKFTQDSLATDYCTELNLCMKCEKAGDLLVCSANTCPIVIHQSCLGTSPSFDDTGKFFCPFCSYSRAISEYRKMKKKASLIRKDLAAFMGLENGHGPNKISMKSSRPEQTS